MARRESRLGSGAMERVRGILEMETRCRFRGFVEFEASGRRENRCAWGQRGDVALGRGPQGRVARGGGGLDLQALCRGDCASIQTCG